VKKVLWGVLALFTVVLLFFGVQFYRLWSAARYWEGPVPEILSEKLEKNADTMEVEFTSRIDAPVGTVFQAFTEPERTQELSDLARYSKLLRQEGNRKVVEFEMVVLGQPQRFILEFTFLPEEKRVTIKTVESQLSDLSGEYRFTPSPDGTKTLLTYSGIAKDKVKMSIPLALQKSAMRETYVSTVRALKKGLATGGGAQSSAPTS
jgi:uncharacterized protein YndB with AHSA1/START domain